MALTFKCYDHKGWPWRCEKDGIRRSELRNIWESPSTDEWIKKMWYLYTMEYYAGIKKNGVLPSATT